MLRVLRKNYDRTSQVVFALVGVAVGVGVFMLRYSSRNADDEPERLTTTGTTVTFLLFGLVVAAAVTARLLPSRVSGYRILALSYLVTVTTVLFLTAVVRGADLPPELSAIVTQIVGTVISAAIVAGFAMVFGWLHPPGS